jgi:ferredoxin-NADP reductase
LKFKNAGRVSAVLTREITARTKIRESRAGATPVLAILHALAAEASTREIWWLYGARSGREHPFAEETRSLLKVLAHGHSHIRYSAPDPEDRPGVDFDAPGRLNMRVLKELSLPRNGDFYICRPSTFMSDLTAGLAA